MYSPKEALGGSQLFYPLLVSCRSEWTGTFCFKCINRYQHYTISNTAPKRAIFFRKEIFSLDFCCASEIFQKACILNVTGIKNTTRSMSDIILKILNKTPSPPRINSIPVKYIARLGIGTPIADA